MKNIFVILVIFLSTFLTLKSYAAQEFGTVKFLKGEGHVVTEAGNLPLEQGDEVNTGEVVAVTQDSIMVLSLHDGSSVRLGPDKTELLLERHLLQENAGAGAKITLKIGEILLNAVHAIDDYMSFEVEVSKGTSIGVRGTTLLAGVDDKDAWASLKEGAMDVYQFDKDDYETVKPGESIVLEGKKTLTKPAAYEWAKKIEWSTDENQLKQLNVQQLKKDFQERRETRRQEFIQRGGELRKREPQMFMQQFQKRQENFRQHRQEIVGKFVERMGQRREQMAQEFKNNPNRQGREQRMQNMKQKMNERGQMPGQQQGPGQSRGEGMKGQGPGEMRGEGMKGEMRGEGLKGQEPGDMRGEGMKGEMRGEGMKGQGPGEMRGEGMKGQGPGEMRGEGMKRDMRGEGMKGQGPGGGGNRPNQGGGGNRRGPGGGGRRGR